MAEQLPFYKFEDSDAVYKQGTGELQNMTWAEFMKKYGGGSELIQSYKNPMAMIAEQMGKFQAPTVESVANAATTNITPTKQTFTQVMPEQSFYQPQQEYMGALATQQYRPEWEKYTLNPWQEQSQFGLAAGGGWRSGVAKQRQQLAQDQMEQQYGSTIQDIINQYTTNVLTPQYQNYAQTWSESPAQNVSEFWKQQNFDPTKPQENTGLTNYVDQYKPSFS